MNNTGARGPQRSELSHRHKNNAHKWQKLVKRLTTTTQKKIMRETITFLRAYERLVRLGFFFLPFVSGTGRRAEVRRGSRLWLADIASNWFCQCSCITKVVVFSTPVFYSMLLQRLKGVLVCLFSRFKPHHSHIRGEKKSCLLLVLLLWHFLFIIIF